MCRIHCVGYQLIHRCYVILQHELQRLVSTLAHDTFAGSSVSSLNRHCHTFHKRAGTYIAICANNVHIRAFWPPIPARHIDVAQVQLFIDNTIHANSISDFTEK
jgi:hypothetical protein